MLLNLNAVLSFTAVILSDRKASWEWERSLHLPLELFAAFPAHSTPMSDPQVISLLPHIQHESLPAPNPASPLSLLISHIRAQERSRQDLHAGPSITARSCCRSLHPLCDLHAAGQDLFLAHRRCQWQASQYLLSPTPRDRPRVLALKHVQRRPLQAWHLNGSAVAVAESLDVSLRTCLAMKNAHRPKQYGASSGSPNLNKNLKPPVDPPQQVVLVSGNGVTPTPDEPESACL